MITIYTDGACSGNPGPAGIGIYIVFENGLTQSISKYIGHQTNNIAELTAIKVGLEIIKDTKYKNEVHVYTDSQYCQGVLSKNWKINTNHDLIRYIKGLMLYFDKVLIFHVRGHNSHPENEIANKLATSAVKNKELNNGTEKIK